MIQKDKELILASHGELAAGMKNTAAMILGNLPFSCTAYGLKPGGDPREFAAQIKQKIQTHPETEFDIVVDLYGASVCSAMYPLAEYANVHLFTGMNLNLVLSLLVEHPEGLAEQDEEKLVEDGRTGIQVLKIQAAAEEDF
jgi:PTS system mannose-specific IIA component